jgi:WD40 repeat protein
VIADATTGQVLGRVPSDKGQNNGLGAAFDPEGRQVAVADGGVVARLWDTVTGHVRVFALPPGSIAISVAFSPRGDRLAVAYGDDDAKRPQCVKVWDTAAGRELLTLRAQTGPLWSVAFSRDGKRIAAGGGNHRVADLPGEVSVWDAVSGEVVYQLKGHTACVWGVTFSPDGKRLASAAGNRGTDKKQMRPGEVKVWDLSTGQELLTLRESGGAAQDVAFSPDGKRLAAACQEGCVKVYGPPEPGGGGR